MFDLHAMKTHITIRRPCPFCGKVNEIVVPKDGYVRWVDGELIQKALPTLSDEEREMLLSGICPPCWDEAFGGPEA